MKMNACSRTIRMWKIAHTRAGDHVADEAKHRRVRAETPHAAEQGNQQEQQFARVHVAEQPHAERNRLCDELDDVQCKVRDPQQRMRAERSGQQFMHEAAYALDLEVVVNHQHEHAERDAERTVQVGGRHDAVMRDDFREAQPADHAARQVDGDEVERVHQGDPDEHGQCERSDEGAASRGSSTSIDLRPSRPAFRSRTGNGPARRKSLYEQRDAG